jgi:hypothetical protein
MAKHTLPRIFDPAADDPPHAFNGRVNVYASSIPATVQSKAYLGIACMVSGRSTLPRKNMLFAMFGSRFGRKNNFLLWDKMFLRPFLEAVSSRFVFQAK